MSRDGLIRENMTTGETENISKRMQENPENDIPKSPISDKEIPKRKSSRLTFTEEERAIPEFQRYIKKSDQAADRLDKARDKIPKKKSLSFEREFDERSGKGKTRLHFEEKEKPIGSGKSANPLSPALDEAGAFVHKKIHETEHDNAGIEAAHKTEKAAETLGRYSVRKARENYRNQKLKPYRKARKAKKAAEKANAKYFYKKAMYENPNLSPAERHAKWKELVQIYQPWLKLDGEIPFYSEGEGWQRQHHIYSSPFYYIDYCLAQTVALQFWNMIQKDQKGAWQHYMAYTKQGGSVVFTKLLKNAGLESPFQESCLRGICDTAAKYLADYDLSGIA